jgi:hypothetical protein
MTSMTTEESDHCATCSCRRGGTLSWRPVVTILLLMSIWDTVGLLFGGNSFYGSPSYSVLRDIGNQVRLGGDPLGVRVYGITLMVISGVVAWALLAQRHHDGRVSKALRLALSALAAYWVAWCFGVLMSFVTSGEVHAWGAIGKLAGIAAIAVLAARVPPPRAAPRRTTGKVNCAVDAPVASTRRSRADRHRPVAGPATGS